MLTMEEVSERFDVPPSVIEKLIPGGIDVINRRYDDHNIMCRVRNLLHAYLVSHARAFHPRWKRPTAVDKGYEELIQSEAVVKTTIYTAMRGVEDFGIAIHEAAKAFEERRAHLDGDELFA